jgi:hypothetical protein
MKSSLVIALVVVVLVTVGTLAVMNKACNDQPSLSGPGGMVVQWMAVSPAWPAEPIELAKPATRRRQARRRQVLAACSRERCEP